MHARTLDGIKTGLEDCYGVVAPPDPTDAFELILWEQVAYLADDERRSAAFRLLERRVGVTPQAILAATPATLTEVAAAGGTIAATQRAQRMQRSAREVIERWDGELGKALRLPAPQALRALQRFPMIGAPGAEKILLYTRTQALLAPESNGLRVLLRLGYGTEGKSYAQSYRNVCAATAAELRPDYDWLIGLRTLLRVHGRELCRRSAPKCAECLLASRCAYAARTRDEAG